jgi:hypothetical protein
MVQRLRENLLYSEKKPRDSIFTAFHAIIRENEKPLVLSKLARLSASRARREAAARGFVFANWETATKAVVNAMLGARVVLGVDGRVIEAGATARACEVAALKTGFRDMTEAFLLEFLIVSMGDITLRDCTALAHALFRQFDPRVSLEDLETRVLLMLAARSSQPVLCGAGPGNRTPKAVAPS